MSDLQDPTKPAGHLIEVNDDGSALRNDGVNLTPASQNPWYVLATVYGELRNEFDHQRAEQNRRIWNGWACRGKSPDERTKLAKKLKLPVMELADLLAEEQSAIRKAFDIRLSPETRIPEPEEFIGLQEVYFSKPVRMNRLIFPTYTSFSHASFNANAIFSRAIFNGGAIFKSVRFNGNANFNFAIFKGDGIFNSANFSHYASFSFTKFRKYGVFNSASFEKRADFGSSQFNAKAWFHSATFNETAEFSDNSFGGQTIFKNALFQSTVPTFYQRTLHQDTEFTIKQANWPTLTKDTASDSKRAYTRLRQMMSELHKPDDEHFFFRQEMRCKLLMEDRWNRWPIYLFSWMSDYGYSVVRPMLWMAGVVLFGAPFIGAHLHHGLNVAQGASIWQGLGVSISNTFPFLGFTRKMHPDFFANAPAWIDALSAGQSILGIILLFLFGLGLRNRFRIK